MNHSTKNKSRPPSASPRATSSAGPDLTGKVFGDFRMLRQLGQGGMGQVYLAEQVSLKRKPENILLTRKGEAKVADFGLSRCFSLDEPIDLTRAGSAVGTPRYMSPEQIEGKAVDYRSDIYSFGVTCYHMLAGQPPFDGANGYEVAVKHVRGESVHLETLRPDLPAPLCALVHKMMAKKPHKRYPSAHDLLKDIVRLRESLNAGGASSPAVTMIAETAAEKTLGRPVPRRKLSVVVCGLALGIVALLVAGAAVLWYSRSPETDPTPVAATRPDDGTAADKTPDKTAEKTADKTADKGREEDLKKAVDRHLKEFKATPAGIEACIDLGVLYLKQQRFTDAEALFKRMDERRPPSQYHYVGRLGLAVSQRDVAYASLTEFAVRAWLKSW